jgi:hypothetical protein
MDDTYWKNNWDKNLGRFSTPYMPEVLPTKDFLVIKDLGYK